MDYIANGFMRRFASVKKFRWEAVKAGVTLTPVTKDLASFCLACPVGVGATQKGENHVCFIGRFGFVTRSDE